MIRILHIITSVQLGGAEIIAFNLAEHCKHKNGEDIETILVELHQTKNTYATEKKQELNQKKIKIISLYKGSRRFSLLVAPCRLLYYVLKVKPQIIHSQTDLPDFTLSICLRILSLLHVKPPKIVRTIQSTELWPSHRRIGKFTEAAFKNDAVVAISQASLEAYKVLRVKSKLSPSPFQEIIYNACAAPIKKEHPFKVNNKKINIVFCGRFAWQKGLDILIERIKQIAVRFDNIFLFHIVGNGPYYTDVVKLSKTCTNVILYDTVPNIADKLYDFDFLIMPSRYEGLGITSLEATLWKVPVIAAVAPGLNETLPIDWPLQFTLDNPEELFSILDKIKNNQYDLNKLKNTAYEFVTEHFSHQQMIESYSKLYTETCE